MSSPQRLLVFGGTFDPPHLAHTVLPPLVAERLECDRVLYVPAALNPLKADTPPTADEHRLNMLQAALRTVPDAEICTLELDRTGPSYMIDTLRELRERNGEGVEMRLLIGADQALDFHRWKNWQEIIALAPPAVMLRPPWGWDHYLSELASRYTPEEVQSWRQWTITLPMIDISSSEIRRRIGAGGELSDILAPPVIDYIGRNGLYVNDA